MSYHSRYHGRSPASTRRWGISCNLDESINIMVPDELQFESRPEPLAVTRGGLHYEVRNCSPIGKSPLPIIVNKSRRCWINPNVVLTPCILHNFSEVSFKGSNTGIRPP